MRRIVMAIRIFFSTLFKAEVAKQVENLLIGISAPPVPALERPPEAKPKEAPARPARTSARSDALSLLSTLQREARFVDFVKEPLAEFSDAQIGAVARDIHRDCGLVLERAFALRPVLPEAEGVEVDVPSGFDPGRYRLTGKVHDQPRIRGTLVHHGWEATACELAAWSGSDKAARIIAPAEVELK